MVCLSTFCLAFDPSDRKWGINGNVYVIEGSGSRKILWGQPDMNLPVGYETRFLYRHLKSPTAYDMRKIYNLVPNGVVRFVDDGAEARLKEIEGIISSFVPR